MTNQASSPHSGAEQFRIVALGYHKVPTLEIDVTPEQQRQLDSAWNVATMFSSPRVISGEIVNRYSEVELRILGFDWETEFNRLCPGRPPQMTTRVLPSSHKTTSQEQA